MSYFVLRFLQVDDTYCSSVRRHFSLFNKYLSKEPHYMASNGWVNLGGK